MRAMDRAFTFIEVLMVVIIMAIAATVVPMALSRNSEAINVPSAARMVVADLTYAQNVAVTQQKQVYAFLSTDGAKITGYDLKIRTPDPANPANYIYDPVVTTDRGAWVTRFGSYGNGQTAAGALRATQLTAVEVVDVNPVTNVSTVRPSSDQLVGSVGFDAQGKPVDSGTGQPPKAFVRFTIANTNGTASSEVRIAPITGNVSMK